MIRRPLHAFSQRSDHRNRCDLLQILFKTTIESMRNAFRTRLNLTSTPREAPMLPASSVSPASAASRVIQSGRKPFASSTRKANR
jgi:hypothetical protein